MFGQNEIVGKSYFAKHEEAQAGKLFVTSMFFTLQGEGPFRGEPAFFIRLAKCNLACSFCDTYFDDGEWLSVREIAERVDNAIADYFEGDVPQWAKFTLGEPDMGWVADRRRMVLVVTGGEPTLQPNLKDLLDWGNSYFVHTQIESNGIVLNDDVVPPETVVVVSPKCAEAPIHPRGNFLNEGDFKSPSNFRATAYLKPNEKMLARANCLKFVMEADLSSPYSQVPDWALKWAKETGKQVFVSPMNVYLKEPQKAKELRARTNQTTIEERSTIDEVISFWEPDLLDMKANQLNHEYTAQYAMKHGLTFNIQQHLLASLA